MLAPEDVDHFFFSREDAAIMPDGEKKVADKVKLFHYFLASTSSGAAHP